MQHHNTLMNLGIAFFLVVFVSCFLFYKYRGKLTPQEQRMQERQKTEYILSKIQNYQETKQKLNERLITDLPGWQTPVDMLNETL